MQLGYNLLLKPKNSQLSCGLFGAAADDVSKININKIKILGIFNDSRGGHSCGVAIDGDIIKGTYKSKHFKDFITNNQIAAPERLPVIIGHTRFATGGAHDEDNAHPFGFGENNDYYGFVGTHNGSLRNHKELASNYMIEDKATISYSSGYKGTRDKIDSEILLEIIYNDGFDVLNDYEGAAALSFYNTRKPKTIYLYHGASKKLSTDKEMVEERPLFYYQEAPGVFYYSSIKESLEAINDTYGEIETFDCNYVYEIKNGNVSNAKKHKVDRSDKVQTKATTYNFTPTDYSNKEWDVNLRKWVDKSKVVESKSKQTVLPVKNDMTLLVKHHCEFEKDNPIFVANNVYYENLRFYKNKTLLNGIYVMNNELELLFLSLYPSLIQEYINGLISDNKITKDSPIMYFINGIALRSETDFSALNYGKITRFTVAQISHCSIYPVKSHDYNLKEEIYFRGELANIKFTPLFGKDILHITNGECTAIETRDNLTLTDYNKYLLPEDKLIITDVTSKKDIKVDDDDIIDLYQDNIIATVDYCIDDIEQSFDSIKLQSILKTKLETIKKVINKILGDHE